MNSSLLQYAKRFITQPIANITTFYTDFNSESFGDQLPYINQIEIFCDRLLQAYSQNEKICIYSDYDTDAVTATATMYWGLVELGFDIENLSFYAPDRFTEGYGMNVQAVSEIAMKNDLIISVDCGINSVAEAAEILKLNSNLQSNCDLIITDHHHLTGELPKCIAICNPRISFDWKEYSFTLLQKKWCTTRFLSDTVTGVGVAWFCVVWLGYCMEKQNNNLV
jgi:hypothetical protein